jgi:uncharacterized membrane protein YbhN (UPF0104 family)
MSMEPQPKRVGPKLVGSRRRLLRVAQFVVSLAIVAGIFAFAMPRVADYSDVWATIADLTWMEMVTLLGATGLNLATYWPVIVASMPGLTLAQAAVVNQTSTSIANTIPGGGAIAVGVSYTMYRSWGFTNADIALTALVTGTWNGLVKLGLPLIALGLLAIQGDANRALVAASLVGVAVLAAGVVLVGLMLWKKRFARAIGSGLGKAASWLRRLMRRTPVTGWAEAAVRFRKQTIQLVAKRWVPLTSATVVSHLTLYLVLLMALRHVGVSDQEVSWAQVLGVFAFVRLLSAVPITPGGLGIVELSYIGGLVLAGRGHADVPPDLFRAQVAAAVLVFRALTYGLQIPLGGVTYVVWRRRKHRRREELNDIDRHFPPGGRGEAEVSGWTEVRNRGG